MVSYLVEQQDSKAADLLTTLIPSLINNGDTEFISQINKQLSVEAQTQVHEKLITFDTKAAQVYETLEVQTEQSSFVAIDSSKSNVTSSQDLTSDLFEFDALAFDMFDSPVIDTPNKSMTDLNNMVAGKTVEEIKTILKQESVNNNFKNQVIDYLQESFSDKVIVSSSLISEGIDIDIDFTDYLSPSECVEVLTKLDSVDGKNKLIEQIKAKPEILSQVLNEDVTESTMQLLTEGKYTLVETEGLFGNVETKITFEIDGLTYESMEKIGEFYSKLYNLSEFEFNTSNGIITDTDILIKISKGGNGVGIFDSVSLSDDYLSTFFPEEFVGSESKVISEKHYTAAPSFSTVAEVIDYAKVTASLEDGINKTAAAFLKRIDEVSASSEIGTSKYYEFLNLCDSGLDPSLHTKVMNKVINSSISLRESIYNGATIELSEVLESRFGITDPLIIGNMRDMLLGSDFVAKGIGEGVNWNGFIDLIRNPIAQAVQDQVDSFKEPVIWSGFSDEYHDAMDKKFTTISNTSIGGLFFIESVYSNWNSSVSTYKVEDLWSMLSEVYAKSCCSAINPYTGTKFTSIKFLYPMTVNMDECFGNLFKTAELPQIVSSGTIKTITMAKTDPSSMSIVGTVDIDISDLTEYYKSHSVLGLIGNDMALNQKIFEMFLKKVKEVM